MKKMKRSLGACAALIIAVAAVVAVFAFSANASGGNAVEMFASYNTTYPGQTVYLNVHAENNSGFAGATINVDFDKNYFTPISVASSVWEADGIVASNLDGDLPPEDLDIVSAVMFGASDWTGEGEFVTFAFKVKEGAPDASSAFNISFDVINSNRDKIAVPSISGSFKMVDESEYREITEFYFDPSRLTVFTGDEADLTWSTNPGATYSGEKWKSSDTSVIKVKDGRITAVGKGEAVVTVSTLDGRISEDCHITVYERLPGKVNAYLTATEAHVGETVTMHVNIDGVPDSGISSIEMMLNYDKTYLKLLTVKDEGIFDNYFFSNFSSSPRLYWSNKGNACSNGVAATVAFEVLKKPDSGSLNVGLVSEPICYADNYTAVDLETAGTSLEIKERAPEDMFKIKLSSTGGKLGSYVTAKVYLENIPGVGISSLDLSLSYDKAFLELVEVKDLEMLSSPEFGGDITAVPYRLTWNSLTDLTEDCAVAELKFKLLAVPDDGVINVDLECNEAFDTHEKVYVPTVVDGTVVERNSTPGDVNNDGNIDTIDLVLIAQEIAGWSVEINEAAADCNGDGYLTTVDLVLLAQKIAGWEVELKGQ